MVFNVKRTYDERHIIVDRVQGEWAGWLHKIDTHTWAHAHLLLQYLLGHLGPLGTIKGMQAYTSIWSSMLFSSSGFYSYCFSKVTNNIWSWPRVLVVRVWGGCMPAGESRAWLHCLPGAPCIVWWCRLSKGLVDIECDWKTQAKTPGWTHV